MRKIFYIKIDGRYSCFYEMVADNFAKAIINAINEHIEKYSDVSKITDITFTKVEILSVEDIIE